MAEEKIMGRDMDNMYQWRKKMQKRYEFYLNKEADKDVMEWLDSQPNKREYIIALLRKDMDGHKEPSDKTD